LKFPIDIANVVSQLVPLGLYNLGINHTYLSSCQESEMWIWQPDGQALALHGLTQNIFLLDPKHLEGNKLGEEYKLSSPI